MEYGEHIGIVTFTFRFSDFDSIRKLGSLFIRFKKEVEARRVVGGLIVESLYCATLGLNNLLCGGPANGYSVTFCGSLSSLLRRNNQ